MSQTQAVQTAPKQPVQQAKSMTLAQQTAHYVEQMTNQWAKVLPSVCTPERFARVALSCLNGNEALAKALSSPQGKISLSKAFMKCAEVGLEPNGRDAHLIPYQNDIQLILDYKGIVKLCRRSGEIANIIAETVHEKDEFAYEDGIIHHKIDFHLDDRGPAYAWYVKVVFKDGTIQTKVMGRSEIEAIRKRSKAKNGPWQTDYDEMAKKTVFKNLSKWLPMAYEPLEQAIQYDNEDEREPIDVTPKSRFETPQAAPQGGLLDALGGQAKPAGQPVEVINVPQEQPEEQPVEQTAPQPEVQPQAAPVDKVKTETAIKLHLKNTQAPIGYADLKAWYEIEFGEWNAEDAMANIDSYVGKAFDWKSNQ